VLSAALRTATMIGALMATVAAVTSCIGSAATEHHGAAPQGSAQAQSAEHNSNDVAFATNMVPHHLQAVELSAMVPSRSTNHELLVMASHISSDQQAEVLTLQGLLAQWGQPAGGPSGHDGHGPETGAMADTGTMAMAMAGMVAPETMNQLRSLRGNAFDELWINSMIDHHQGAITMAQDELAHGQSADARHLAELIITAQSREIAQMNELLGVTQ